MGFFVDLCGYGIVQGIRWMGSKVGKVEVGVVESGSKPHAEALGLRQCFRAQSWVGARRGL